MKEKRKEKKDKEKKSRLGFINTIRFKAAALLACSVMLTAGVSRIATMPKFEAQVTEITEAYMLDNAKLIGQIFDEAIDRSSVESVLSLDNLKKHVSDIRVGDLATSYCYIVAKDGTMLYHPTADKVGKPVENVVVTQLVSDIKQGKQPEPDIIRYEFKDAMKYAAYSVGEHFDFIVVVTADEQEVLSTVSATSKFSGLVETVNLFIAVAWGYFILTLMIKPIVKVAGVTKSMASMDFRETQILEKYSRRGDEAGLMTRSIIHLREELLKVIEQISGQSAALNQSAAGVDASASEVLRSTEQVESAVNEIASGATSQAQETQTATESMIVMGKKIEETNTEINVLRESADEMNQAGQQAMDTLILLKEVNNQTKGVIQTIYDQTNTTNASAMKIKEATEIITSIAAETNLLSLNASIEAARAGEQGRGFSVVAAQIQKLAEQSNNSAGQIAKIIGELLEDSAKSVASMDEVKLVIEKQDEYVENTSNSFRNVKAGIDKSMEEVQSLFDKTEELNEARVKVMDVIQNLTAIAEENAASTEETSASVAEVGNAMEGVAKESEELMSIAQKLDKTVGVFQM